MKQGTATIYDMRIKSMMGFSFWGFNEPAPSATCHSFYLPLGFFKKPSICCVTLVAAVIYLIFTLEYSYLVSLIDLK